MKSPADLARQLARRWQGADFRENHLLSAEPWPLVLAIGKPSAGEFAQSSKLRTHLQQWRSVTTGKVDWQGVNFRSASEAVQVPIYWIVRSPSELIAAIDDAQFLAEYRFFSELIQELDPQFHRIVVRQRHLILDKPAQEVIQTGQLVLQLEPGCANGKPLRALSLAGVDSKFFERNRSLIIRFLELRFGDIVNIEGLESFLDAVDDKDQWLLLAPLEAGLLPFEQQRVRSRELAQTSLPARNILVVENERCLHQLPALSDTIAILGAGLNLRWMSADWLRVKAIAYWGDMDTWGLHMLAVARRHQSGLTPLLMRRSLFDAHVDKAVLEPIPADEVAPNELTDDEQAFYRYLLSRERGRLEQEFLPGEVVAREISAWRDASSTSQ